jgi:hypothetical protein
MTSTDAAKYTVIKVKNDTYSFFLNADAYSFRLYRELPEPNEEGVWREHVASGTLDSLVAALVSYDIQDKVSSLSGSTVKATPSKWELRFDENGPAPLQD